MFIRPEQFVGHLSAPHNDAVKTIHLTAWLAMEFEPLDTTAQKFTALPQQLRITRLFKSNALRLESCPQSYPPFEWMCCNETMRASEMITAFVH